MDVPFSAHARKFVLVVDDDKSVLKHLHMVLEAAEYEAHCAESAHEAIAKIGDRRPDIVLTDIYMIESDGFELINWMRSHAGSIPVIAMSEGNPMNLGELSTAERLGAVAVLDKPFLPGMVIETIARILSQQDIAA
jgi:DNA-binding NtrC family response regulator